MYPVGILFIFAYVLYILFFYKGSLKDSFLNIGSGLLGYISILLLFSGFIMATGMSDHGIQKYDNKWKFVLGLNAESNGQYSKKDFESLLPSYLNRDEKKHSYLEGRLIEERLNNHKLKQLLIKKNLIMWGSPTDSYLYAGVYPKNLERNKAVHAPYIRLETCQYGIIVLFMIITAVYLLVNSRKLINLECTFFQMIIVGGYLIYLVTEIQIRYRYFFIPLMVIVASNSLGKLMDKIILIRGNRSN